MGQTLAEKILSHKVGRPVRAGELVVVEVDQVMVVDSIAGSFFKRLEYLEATPRYPERVSIVIDHVAPAANLEVAKAQKEIREWGKRHGIRVFDVGRGVCHQVLIEEGLAQPGWVVVGSDSHSTTYGAVGAFGTGMGATDIALAAASGRTWLRVPESVKVVFRGRLPKGVTAKDAALEMVRLLTAEGATYMAVEIHLLDGAEALTRGERMTLANLTVEAGAKAGLVVPSGEILEMYRVPDWLYPDPDARYAKEVEIDLSALTPRVSVPFYVDNVHEVAQVKGKRVDQVFIGTCTTGRLEDLSAAPGTAGRPPRRAKSRIMPLLNPVRHTVEEDRLHHSEYRRKQQQRKHHHSQATEDMRRARADVSRESSFEKVDTRWLVALALELHRRTVSERRV